MSTMHVPGTRHGQGKIVTTLLTEGGCYYPTLAHDTYNERQKVQSVPISRGRGARPMHTSTLEMMRTIPSKDDFITLHKQHFGGSASMNPAKRRTLAPSMQVSKVRLGYDDSRTIWNTNYGHDYVRHNNESAIDLHVRASTTRKAQRSGDEMKAAVRHTSELSSYWSQYNRIHSKLGSILGPGVPRERPIRRNYDFISGTMGDPAWKSENRRISGNRVLHAARENEMNNSVIG